MHLGVIVVLIIGFAIGGKCESGTLAEEFRSGLATYQETGVKTDSFEQILSEYALTDEVRNTPNWYIGDPRAPRAPICRMCDVVVSMIIDEYANGTSAEDLAATLTDVCITLNIYPARVCEGIIVANIDSFEYVLANTPNLTSDRFCAVVFQGDDCGEDDPSLDWTVDLGGTRKPSVNYVPYESKAEPLNIIHVTDIHYDPNYMVGGNADCNEPTCCRGDQGIPEFANTTAGRWGDYRDCDIPWDVMTDAMRQITAQHPQIDYVFMTGDLIDHAVWDTSTSKNNATFVKIFNELKSTFGDIPVFPCFGNHEPHPLNVFAPTHITDEKVSSAWLYETMADLWGMWLPAETRETILRGGFYTVPVRPGYRIITLNSMQCYTFNWFIVYDSNDPDDQLRWLVDELLKSELIGEKVHLLYHIPPGSNDCYKVWSREFNRIIDRFESTIIAQFGGHTHNDEFHIFYSHDEPDRANNVLYIGGALTTFSNVNANYRLYNVDPDTWSVVDHETWIYNLTAANLTPDETPTWFKMYSFKEAYKVSSLEPVEMDRLAHDMATNSSIMQQYFEFYYLYGDPKMEQGCDQNCYDGLLCSIVTTDSSANSTRCDNLLS